MAGRRLHSGDPVAHRRMVVEVEAGLVRHVHVRVDRDVGDRVALAGQERVFAQVALEDVQHRGSRGAPALGRRAVRVEPAGLEAEAQAGDPGNDLALLVEQPAHHLGPRGPVVRQQLGALGQVGEDRVRLGQRLPVIGFEDGRHTGRIEARELVRERVAAEDVDVHALVVDAELGQQQPHLEAVARGRVVVQAHQLAA